jgi:hypothetical protein
MICSIFSVLSGKTDFFLFIRSHPQDFRKIDKIVVSSERSTRVVLITPPRRYSNKEKNSKVQYIRVSYKTKSQRYTNHTNKNKTMTQIYTNEIFYFERLKKLM